MIVLVPNSQDTWTDLDWATFNFLQHISDLVDSHEQPSIYYEMVSHYAQEEYDIELRIVWHTLDAFLEEPAGWYIGIKESSAELTAFVLKWR